MASPGTAVPPPPTPDPPAPNAIGAPLSVAAAMATERGVQLTWAMAGPGNPMDPRCAVSQQEPAPDQPILGGVFSVVVECPGTRQ